MTFPSCHREIVHPRLTSLSLHIAPFIYILHEPNQGEDRTRLYLVRLGFACIDKYIHPNTVTYGRSTPHLLLWLWVKILRKEILAKGENAPTEPADDIVATLAIFCRVSPKLRATLLIIADLVSWF